MLLECDAGWTPVPRTESSERRPQSSRSPGNERYLAQALSLRPVLARIINRITRNSPETDDLLQEVYVRIIQWMHGNEPSELRSFQAFAIRIAQNVTLDWARHLQTVWFEYRPAPEDEEEPDLTSDVSHLVAAEQELDRLAAMVGRLPQRCRQAFTLRKVYGMCQKEIAQTLHISEHTVEQHLTKAAKKISAFQRQSLGRRDSASLTNPYRRKR